MPETMFTPQEIADRLKLSVETIYDYIASGKLEAVKIGNKYRVYGDSLKKFLDACRVGSKA